MRPVKLKPGKYGSARFVTYIPGSLTKTGRRQPAYNRTKEAADAFCDELNRRLAERKVDPYSLLADEAAAEPPAVAPGPTKADEVLELYYALEPEDRRKVVESIVNGLSKDILMELLGIVAERL